MTAKAALSLVMSSLLLFGGTLFSAPGDVDTTFGTSGIALTSLSGLQDGAEDVEILPGGNIIVAGGAKIGAGGSYNSVLLRYTSLGVLDTTFGVNGVASRSFGAGDDSAISVHPLSSGKLMVVASSSSPAAIYIARYNENGTIDTTFGTSGVVTQRVEVGITVQDAFWYDDGRVVVAGSSNLGTRPMSLFRFNASGSLDQTFGLKGYAAIRIGNIFTRANAVIAIPGGKLVVAGVVYDGVTNEFLVARLNANGTLDKTFNSAGSLSLDLGASDAAATCLAVQPDGKIVAAGAKALGVDGDTSIVRINTNGRLDTSFGSSGVVDITSFGLVSTAIGVHIREDAKILIGGSFYTAINEGHYYSARLTSTGALDGGFGTSGISSFVRNGLDICTGSAVQTDGSLVLCGSTQDLPRTDFSLVRFSSPAAKLGVFAGASTAEVDRLSNGEAFVFPHVPVGSMGTPQTFTVKNEGSLDITSFTNLVGSTGQGGDFTFDMSGVPATLAAGATATFTVVFAPTAEGTRTTSAIFNSVGQLNTYSVLMRGFTQTVSFDQATLNRLEDAVTLSIPVRLSAVVGETCTVPVTVTGGTATPGSDFTGGTATLVFAATQTLANVKLTLKDDLVVEGNETVILSLGAPSISGLALGANPSITVTIEEDDVLPVIAPALTNQLVAVGDPVSWVSGATGSNPLTLSWKKNTTRIAGANTGTYNIAAAVLADGATYTFSAANQRGTATSVAQLGVVDQVDTLTRADLNKTVVLSFGAAGKSLSFQWKDPMGNNITNSAKYAGATSPKLTIKLLQATDTGIYTCVVNGPGGTINSGDHTLNVATAPPITNALMFPDVVTHNPYSYQIPYDTTPGNAPTSFLCTGLPSGVKCDAKTGLISGKPTRLGAYLVSVTLSNATGSATTVQDTFSVLPYPTGAVGGYVSLVQRHADTNAELGGRLDLTTTATGGFTGNARLGTRSYTLTGQMLTAPTMGAHPMITLTLKRTGDVPVLLDLDLNPTNNEVTGTVMESGGVSSALHAGWRNIWRTKAPANPVTDRLGLHTFKLEIAPPDVAGQPQGYGHGSISVAASGATKVSGFTSDKGSIASSAPLSPDGEALVFQLLYGNRGSVLGLLEVANNVNHTVTGMLNWQRTLASSSVRDYAPFGPVVLNASGALYVSSAPILGLAVGLNNANLVFTKGGVSLSATNPDVTFTISASNKATFPLAGSPSNPGRITSLTINAAAGTFSGKFILADPGAANRTGNFQGQLLSGEQKGYGFFLLPQLPDPMGSPPTTVNTSPILSGMVVLQ
jgi:uncharacterized delta-60 repeat protein